MIYESTADRSHHRTEVKVKADRPTTKYLALDIINTKFFLSFTE